ncbi:winged helix-turn-helix transcriptional regulator [Haloarcula sp. JP-L23]|nr:winged helix-turn-helix transcriptional regulator [Haloarcula sp. JP-L23]
MMPETDRLERLIADECGECCESDVAERLESLEAYRDAIPDDAGTDRSALQTLSNETRYDIVYLLAAADRELCVCEINPLVDVSDSAISHALSDLHDAGLVTRRKNGTWRYYETTDRAAELVAALDATRGGE